jgi:hypothetical protein
MSAGDAIQQFRIIGWPGRLPHPILADLYRYDLDEDEVLTGRLGRAKAPSARGEIPTSTSGRVATGRSAREVADTGEIYLELFHLELGDTEAIVHFVNRYGVLGISYNDYALVRHLPGFQEKIRLALEASWPPGRKRGLDARLHRGVMLVETLVEFRLGASCLRDLVRAWQMLASGASRSSTQWESVPAEHEIHPIWTDATTDPATRADEAESFLIQMLNAGLEPFHPRLMPTNRSVSHPGTLLHGPLYSVCCLELYNHILEHATYRECANDRCRQIFVRQTGRADQGQHRSEGIKYCSKHCARAQAQRAYRARQQAASRRAAGESTKKIDPPAAPS